MPVCDTSVYYIYLNNNIPNPYSWFTLIKLDKTGITFFFLLSVQIKEKMYVFLNNYVHVIYIALDSVVCRIYSHHNVTQCVTVTSKVRYCASLDLIKSSVLPICFVLLLFPRDKNIAFEAKNPERLWDGGGKESRTGFVIVCGKKAAYSIIRNTFLCVLSVSSICAAE